MPPTSGAAIRFITSDPDSARIGPHEIVDDLAAAAFDFDALAWAQRVLLDLLQQPATAATVRLYPSNVWRVLGESGT